MDNERLANLALLQTHYDQQIDIDIDMDVEIELETVLV